MTPDVGSVVSGRRLGGRGTARYTVKVTEVVEGVAVIGLLTYATTFTPGGRYEGSYRGITVLDPATVQPVEGR